MKPHIHFHGGYWFVLPWKGACWGIGDPDVREAWNRWRKHPWVRVLMAKGKPKC